MTGIGRRDEPFPPAGTVTRVTPDTRQPALLLIGPTGVGKSPLGGWLEAHGLAGQRCHHFDCGANLRAAAGGALACGFSDAELRYVRSILEKGALLTNDTFHLALRILGAFILDRGIRPGDLLILNGLPRHVGQAAGLEEAVRIDSVVVLQADAGVVTERLRLNVGGDRTSRVDDDPALVQRKLATFAEQTLPLIEHYRQRGARIVAVRVEVGTKPEDAVRLIDESLSAHPVSG